MGKFPPGAWAETYLESVTSALIRASGVLRLPAAAILYVRNCPVAALCQEESGSSRILDSPSAIAKDDCFVGLCLQGGPCNGRELPCGGFRGPEGGRSTHLPVCTAPGGSPSLSPSLPPRSRRSVAQEGCNTDSRDVPHSPFSCSAAEMSPLGRGVALISSSKALVEVGGLCQALHTM